MHELSRTANLLGATALVVTDLMLSQATRAAGVSASGAAALMILRDSPGLSVTELGRRVGLSQSAAARMVDSLKTLVRRVPTSGREVAVHLTPEGATTAEELLTARGEPLTDLLEALDERRREALAGLLESLLARLYERVGNTDLMCRLCDRHSCTRSAPCPVGAASRR